MKKLRPTKRSFVIVLLLMLNLLLSAQFADAIPALVSYQGKVTDSAQNPLEGNYQMIFRLYETDGTVPIWAEEQTVHISNGIYTVYLGAGANIVGGDLAAALFSPGDRWLEVEIEGEVLSPRQQLTSVVYAFRAQEADFAIEAGNADTLDGLDSAQFMGAAGGQVQGDLEVKGIFGFNSDGEEGTVFLGDTNNYIKAVHGSGVRIGAFDADNALAVQQTTGNVGIGTTAPAVKLDVAGNANVSGALRVGSDTKNLTMFTSGEVIDLLSNGSTLGINYPGNSDTVINADGGRVGIGTIDLLAKLNVNTASETGINAFTGSSDAWDSAVYGRNTGTGFGVYGWSQENFGTVGVTYSSDGTRAGVQGINNGDGRGVYGYATGADGVGVYGESGSATGNGVEGKGYYGVSGQGTQIGVLAMGGLYGLWATASVPSPGAAIGGLNSATNGIAVSGTANGQNGVAVKGEATGANGTAVMANGDLFVGGAYKGNIGPNNGAPFPRPVYDSGTVKTDNDNPCVRLTTGLDIANYNYENFVVDLWQMGQGYWMMNDPDEGYWYRFGEDNDIFVCQNKDFCCGNYFRARIWYYK
jgi:hypothetical protein